MPQHPGSPRLRSVDILVWLYREHPKQFTIRDIMQRYKIARGEAQRRVNYMRHSWSTVKVIGKMEAHRRGRREIVYALTAWGNKYAQRRARGGELRRVAANPEE